MAASVATALFVAAAVDAEGSFFPTAWPLLGAALATVACALVLAGGAVPGRLLYASGAFVLFGGVCVASVAWGGLPDVGWTWLDQMLIAAAALAVGGLAAQLGGAPGRRAVLAGVLAGTTVEAAYLLVRVAAGDAPSSWFDGREVAGPVQYHNGQAASFALAIPLALWASTSKPTAARAAGGFATAALGAGTLLTQSRGAVIAVAIALVAQATIARNARLAAHVVVSAFVVALLVLPLRDVDRALVDSPGGDPSAFRAYAWWTLLGGVALATLFALPRRHRVKIGLAALAATLVVGTVALAIPRAGEVSAAVHRALNGEKPADLPAGEIRLSSLSLSGRRQIWRIALDAYEDHPVLGLGSGSFTERFTQVRQAKDLYVLQPHSLELEALAELGIPGIVALLAAFAALGIAIARAAASRGAKATAAAVVVVLVAQASIDWTFSFPALVAPAFLVAGAVAGSGAQLRRSGRRAVVAWCAGTVLALAAFAGPFFAAHDLSVAQGPSTSPDRAWTLLRHARAFDPWNPDVLDEQGQLAESAREYDLAARLYRRAGTLSRNAWAEEYRRARALREAGHVVAARAACARAQAMNPIEPLLEQDACDFDTK